ncbi:MAG: hypothetical protein L5655_05560 [Thermosediminibacteraceae bacterium]|nr:hypothetical protein [Thermosediminibacteraceae bacterium]
MEFKYLICDGNYSFIKEGESAISHGGIALEEVVVPFARIINWGRNEAMKFVGFLKPVKLEWLNITADELKNGNLSSKEIKKNIERVCF